MIQATLYDADGVVLRSGQKFSARFSRDYGVPVDEILPFFQNEFQECARGTRDLKEAILPHLRRWGWNESVEDLLRYWFEGERELDIPLLTHIQSLRHAGIPCYLETNNEQYRTNDLWNTIHLSEHFDGIFASYEIGSVKSEPQFWQTIVDRLSLLPSSILVWDDDEHDLAQAKTTELITQRYTTFAEYQRIMKSLNIA